MTLARPSPRAESLLLWAFVALACIARFIHLDSDPKFEHWIGYITDEGRWVETARNLALFGDLRLYFVSKLHLVLSPGFQAVNYVLFELAGVNFWTARIWTAACGAAVVIVSFLLLRKIASGLPLWLGLVVLAFEPLTLSLGRVAIPEVPSLLFTLLAFVAISSLEKRLLGAVFGGLFMALAISMKSTTMLMAPVFLLMTALSGVPESTRQRVLRCSAFLLGVVIPALIGLALVLAAGIIKVEGYSELFRPLSNALGWGSAYSMVARLVESSTEYGNVNLLLLAAWVCSWILIFRKEYRGTRLGEIYELSGIWAAGWFVVWMPLAYTPSRYSVHWILPLVIHLVAGLSLWRTIGVARVLTRINVLRARWGIVFFGWLVLPAAVIISTLIMALAGLAGAADVRLAYKLFAIVAIAAVFAVLARAARSAEGSMTGFIAFTVVAALLRMTIEQVGAIALSPSSAKQLLPVIELAMLGGAAWYCLAKSTSIVSLLERASAKALLCSLALVGLLLQSAPILLQPTYSIRDASRNTVRLFPDAVLLRSFQVGSLLIETRLPYRDAIPESTVVDGLLTWARRTKLGPDFVPVTTYRLRVHPRYHVSTGQPVVESGSALVDVYRNTHPQRLYFAPSVRP
jgi:hypothetical protein